MNVHDRFKDYDEEYCWQYHIRQTNQPNDLKEANLTDDEAANLKVTDFAFSYVDDKQSCKQVKEFIQKHEWLGKLPNRPTQRFVAKLGDVIAGAVIMAVPNTFSNLLGKENRDREKLISRGACISWSPKHLGSWLIMKSVNWMVDNTDFRFFTAYSDPEAKELGTIYQACNFIYLGQEAGTNKSYFDPANPGYGWFSGRNFRHKSKYRRYAKEAGIQWKSEWIEKYTPLWNEMPVDVVKVLKDGAKAYEARCVCRESRPKHKYCYILGKDRKETKNLKRLFAELNPGKIDLPYPKERGK